MAAAVALDDDQLAGGLARALVADGGSVPEVRVTGTASVGANRRTVFIDIERAGQVTPAVAQLGGLQLEGVPIPVEAACVRLAAAAGVPVAEPLAASDDPAFVGSPFQISRRVDGITVPRHILRAVADRPALGPLLTDQCGAAMAALHAIDTGLVPEAVARLTDPSPTEAYLPKLQALATMLPLTPPAALALRWLDRHHPEPAARPSLVHSDLRNGNLIVDDDGLAAVIDWELTHVGDPMEDLAWLCLRCWRFRADDLEVGGFGRLADLRAAYEAAGGVWRDPAFRWWKVARTLWWGLVLRLQANAFVSGASSSLVLAASGRRTAELEYDLLMLIRPAR